MGAELPPPPWVLKGPKYAGSSRVKVGLLQISHQLIDEGEMCHQHKTCSHWTWIVPRSSMGRGYTCCLKNSDGGARWQGNTISGEESCYKSTTCDNVFEANPAPAPEIARRGEVDQAAIDAVSEELKISKFAKVATCFRSKGHCL